MRQDIIARRGVLAGVGSLLAAPALVRAQGQNGVALVIGNSKYQWEASLPNVKRDAPDIANRFQTLGLKTELLQDLGRDAMLAALEKFKGASRGANLAALYFAGHGLHWSTTTYIVPVDVDIGTVASVQNLPSVSSIREGLNGARRRLLVFDSCRNNPADGWQQKWAVEQAAISRGAEPSAPNTLVMFSTAPGRAALDGPAGQNSPFAAALLRQMAGPSTDLQALPANLRRDLLIATEGRQVLWAFNTYKEAFTLNGPPGAGSPGSSGRSGDPSRILELPNAYAFARQHDHFMPPGLVAIRPAQRSRDGEKIGAVKFDVPNSPPAIVIVVSVAVPQEVDVILMNRNKNVAFWRSARGTLSGDTLEFTGASWGSHFSLQWKNANSGTLTQRMIGLNVGAAGVVWTKPFARLDG